MKKDNLNSGIVILRILLMIWIIAFHFANKGLIDIQNQKISLNWIIMAFSYIGGDLETVLLF